MDRNTEILYLSNDEESKGLATLEEIRNLLDFDIDLEKNIYVQFPIEEIDGDKKVSSTKGSYDIINLFRNLSLEKRDFLMSFNDIEYLGIDDKEEIVLKLMVSDDDIMATSIYNFSSQFYDKFKIRGYAKHCIDRNRHDMVLRNINEMLVEMKEEENQYRLLKKDNEYYLRAFTSKIYKNYDNKMAVYLMLYALEKFKNDNGNAYYVDSGYIGDSSMNLLFTKDDVVELSRKCKVTFSLNLSNSEIADEALRISLRYVITDDEGRAFSAMVTEPICRITHTMSNLEGRYNELFKVEKYESNILDIVKTINTDSQLSEDGVYYLFKKTIDKVSGDKDITKSTKDKFKDLQQNHLIESTLTLLKCFDKLSSIETDINERIFIERIFHQVIQEYSETYSLR